LGVREGIIKHSRDYSAEEHPELAQYMLDQQPPLEAQVIDLADEIAYLTADFDDGFEAEILAPDHVRASVTLFEQFYAPMKEKYPEAREKLVSNEALKRMLNALVGDLIEETQLRVKVAGAATLDGVRQAMGRLVAFSPPMEKLRLEAKRYLYAHLYHSPELERDHEEADKVTTTLFHAWVENPRLLPPSHAAEAEAEGAPRVVADYIAGMTDAYILKRYNDWIESKK
jgi:dGTPase